MFEIKTCIYFELSSSSEIPMNTLHKMLQNYIIKTKIDNKLGPWT